MICLGTYLSFRFLWILRWDLSRYLPSFSLSFIFALWSVWVLTFLFAYFFHFYPVICLGTYLSFRLFFSILPRNLSGYLAFFFLSFNFTLWSVETGTSTIRPVLFFFCRLSLFLIRLCIKIPEKFQHLILQDTYSLSTSSLGCKALCIVDFLFCGPFVKVLPTSTSRMVPSILPREQSINLSLLKGSGYFHCKLF